MKLVVVLNFIMKLVPILMSKLNTFLITNILEFWLRGVLCKLKPYLWQWLFFLSIFPEREAYRAFRALGLFTSHFFYFSLKRNYAFFLNSPNPCCHKHPYTHTNLRRLNFFFFLFFFFPSLFFLSFFLSFLLASAEPQESYLNNFLFTSHIYTQW